MFDLSKSRLHLSEPIPLAGFQKRPAFYTLPPMVKAESPEMDGVEFSLISEIRCALPIKFTMPNAARGATFSGNSLG